MSGRPDLFDVPQILTVAIDDTVIATLELGSLEPTYHAIPIPAASLGVADPVALTLNVDPTFVPSAVTDGEDPDDRELGVQVFYAFLDQN